GVQRLALFDLALASFALGNSDQHGKNVSFLHDGQGSVQLAPAYDIVSTQAWGDEYGHTLAMPFGEELEPDRVTPRHVERLAGELGLAVSGASGRASALLKRLSDAPTDAVAGIRAEGWDDPIVDSVLRVFARRSRQLIDH
ncbi:MAG: HipA domain-containing protein, partial [Thermoleophilia bacterium]|nr:HipA domain-containing protein [Thermoleophilia bacterium]